MNACTVQSEQMVHLRPRSLAALFEVFLECPFARRSNLGYLARRQKEGYEDESEFGSLAEGDAGVQRLSENEF
jgi:hypothetical protein